MIFITIGLGLLLLGIAIGVRIGPPPNLVTETVVDSVVDSVIPEKSEELSTKVDVVPISFDGQHYRVLNSYGKISIEVVEVEPGTLRNLHPIIFLF